MTQPVHVVVRQRLGVSADRIFDACLDPAWVSRWMPGSRAPAGRIVRVTMELRVGGNFSCVVERQGTEVDYFGAYLEVDRPSLLVFTWAPRGDPSDVSRIIIEIEPYGEGADVKLTHVRGTHWSGFVDRAAHAWCRMFDALERALRRDCAA